MAHAVVPSKGQSSDVPAVGKIGFPARTTGDWFVDQNYLRSSFSLIFSNMASNSSRILLAPFVSPYKLRIDQIGVVFGLSGQGDFSCLVYKPLGDNGTPDAVHFEGSRLSSGSNYVAQSCDLVLEANIVYWIGTRTYQDQSNMRSLQASQLLNLGTLSGQQVASYSIGKFGVADTDPLPTWDNGLTSSFNQPVGLVRMRVAEVLA